jgi:hypothetical protein
MVAPVALLVNQLSTAESPSLMLAGEAVNDNIVSGTPGAGGDAGVVPPVVSPVVPPAVPSIVPPVIPPVDPPVAPTVTIMIAEVLPYALVAVSL